MHVRHFFIPGDLSAAAASYAQDGEDHHDEGPNYYDPGDVLLNPVLFNLLGVRKARLDIVLRGGSHVVLSYIRRDANRPVFFFLQSLQSLEVEVVSDLADVNIVLRCEMDEQIVLTPFVLGCHIEDSVVLFHEGHTYDPIIFVRAIAISYQYL